MHSLVAQRCDLKGSQGGAKHHVERGPTYALGYTAQMRMSTWQEGGYIEEIGLRVWRKANVIKEGGASSFHSFIVDDIVLVVLTS